MRVLVFKTASAAITRGIKDMRKLCRTLTVSIIAAVLTAGTLTFADADARSISYDLNIPSEDLTAALQSFAIASHHKLLYKAELTAGKISRALKGHFTAQEAMEALLSGTGLAYEITGSSVVLIKNQRDDKTSDSREERTPFSPPAAPQSDGQHSILLARVDQSAAGPQVANAKEEEPKKNEALEEIVVTGTHIHGIDNKTNPVIVIDQSQIQQSGYSSTQDLLRSLPQNFSSGDASEDGILTSNNGAFQNTDYGSGINLRGLGATSTLVLLNGHRLAPSSSGSFVDVSTIPLAAIERVEILTDGSSAIYGSDAVGGVVNIILKSDYEGADSTARYGATSDGGRDEILAAQTLGSKWTGGNVVGTVQFQRQDSLPSRDRTFAADLPYPNDLLPQTKRYSATLDGRQALSDQLEFFGDILLARRDFTHASSFASSPGQVGPLFTAQNSGNANSIDVTPGLRYQFAPQWSVDVDGLYGYQKSTVNGVNGDPYPQLLINTTSDNRYTEKSIDLVVNGRFGSLPGGDVGVAIGTSYRVEALDAVTTESGASFPTRGDRNVSAEFLEFHLPILSHGQGVPLVDELELSAAVRRDRYSDFGSTTNPRLGLHWAPWSELGLRASYGRSFRAPTEFEESEENTANQSIYIYQVASPSGSGVVPALIQSGSQQLVAETARTYNFGLDYKPLAVRGLRVALDYYDIVFNNRIITPPIPFNFLQQPGIYGSLISPIPNDAAAQAIVNAAVAEGALFNDFYGNGVTGVRYLYDDRQQNAATVRQSGVDLTSSFTRSFKSLTSTSRLNLSYIDKIDTQFAPGGGFANQVNTVGNPVRWRARFDSTLSSDTYWAITGALNGIGSYINNASPGNPSIASWTTLDFNATFDIGEYLRTPGWRGVSFSVVTLNALNRAPPFVTNGTATYPVSYDPTNANPLGRFVALTLRKKW